MGLNMPAFPAATYVRCDEHGIRLFLPDPDINRAFERRGLGCKEIGTKLVPGTNRFLIIDR